VTELPVTTIRRVTVGGDGKVMLRIETVGSLVQVEIQKGVDSVTLVPGRIHEISDWLKAEGLR
jgi:hypothetical protein